MTPTLAASYQYDWDIFFRSVFAPDHLILGGLWLTVSISIAAQLIGVVIGGLAAFGRLSGKSWAAAVSAAYVWLFRGTPLLVQISFVYFGLGVAGIFSWPDAELGPLMVPGAVLAGVVALGLNEGAYMTEIIRAGIISVDPGQLEAARSLGMRYRLAMRRIVLPQAARIIVPPLGNEFNTMLKSTSLLVAISVPELYVIFSRKNGSGSTVFHPFELFLAAAVWYLALTTVWAVLQGVIERRLNVGHAPTGSGGLRRWLLGSNDRPPSGYLPSGR